MSLTAIAGCLHAKLLDSKLRRRVVLPRPRVCVRWSNPASPNAEPVRKLHQLGTTLRTGKLDVGDGYKIYFQEHGNSDGIPAVFLHGGPGAGCSQRMAQLFDPKHYRVILFDQRGCGRSKKDGLGAADQLEDNTTWHLVEDMERLREHLGVKRWVVCGGSWGTCLALAYASRHREQVLGMVLRAVCLFREKELEFFLGPNNGASNAASNAWKRLTSWLPWVTDGTPARLIAAAFRRAALGDDPGMAPQDAVRKWVDWENALFSTKAPNNFDMTCRERDSHDSLMELPPVAKSPARKLPPLTLGSMQALLTIHYVAERGFFPPGFELLESAGKFSFPLTIVHGRHDCICPVQNARDLADAVPHAQFIATNAGHSQWDSANIDAFVRGTDSVAATVGALA